MEPKISELQIGKAGEYLVCADLIISGFIAFPSEQGLPFDVVAEANGELIRIQVKTTKGTRTLIRYEGRENRYGYLFNINRKGKHGQKKYGTGEVDMFALVSLDSRQIGYLLPDEIKRTMIFRNPSLTYSNTKYGRYLNDFSFQDALCRRSSSHPPTPLTPDP